MFNTSGALLVADAAGHIIERIGRSWIRHGRDIRHEMRIAGQDSSFSLCRRARQLGVVHWIDQLAYQALGKAVRAPQVAMVHHWTEDCLEQGIASLRYCDAITTTSLHWRSKLEKRTQRPVVLIPYSIDSEVFRPPVDREAAKAAAGIPPKGFAIGFLGKAGANQANRKGIDVFEAVVKAAAQRWRDLNVVLVGPGWRELATRIEHLGVRIVWRQYQTTEETVEAYALMDALLVTSSEEGGPCTILEAMACGVPAVTSVVGHVPELVRDGETGLLCPTRSEREYLEQLDNLRRFPELHRRISGQAREFVVQERDDSVVIPRIDFRSLYRDAAASFQTRSLPERAVRRLPLCTLYARHVARPLGGRVRRALTGLPETGLFKYRRLKRVLDMAVALPALPLLAPLMLCTALFVRLTMGAPVLFRQKRTGLHGRTFTLLKFRSMRQGEGLSDAERLTPAGALLRRLSIDELPQLWNVLRGDMSLVGPRPLLPEYLPWYSDVQRRRHEVKPGITGWAQIHNRNALPWEEKLERDVWYVDHAGLWLDLVILFKTVGTVLDRKGISEPGQVTATKFCHSVCRSSELP